MFVRFSYYVHLISNYNFSTLFKKLLTGLFDEMTAIILHQSYVTQRPSLFTLISYGLI